MKEARHWPWHRGSQKVEWFVWHKSGPSELSLSPPLPPGPELGDAKIWCVEPGVAANITSAIGTSGDCKDVIVSLPSAPAHSTPAATARSASMATLADRGACSAIVYLFFFFFLKMSSQSTLFDAAEKIVCFVWAGYSAVLDRVVISKSSGNYGHQVLLNSHRQASNPLD